MRLFAVLLLITAPSLAGQFQQTPLAMKLTELRKEAEANFARLTVMSDQLKEKKAPQADWDQYWHQRNYWFHYVGVVDDLARISLRHGDGPSAAARLEVSKKAERETGASVRRAADGSISFHPGSPSYERKRSALKNGAAIAVYSQLLSYDLKSGAVLTEVGSAVLAEPVN